MRTTLVIPDSIYARARKAAGQLHKTVSELVSEAIELRLLALNEASARPAKALKIKSFSMGKEQADLSNREALYRKMEE